MFTGVHKLVIAVTLAVLLALPMCMPSAYAFDQENQQNINLGTNPQITVNVTKTVTANISYSGIILVSPVGVVGSRFENQAWRVTNISGGVSYESDLSLMPVNESLYPEVENLVENLTGDIKVTNDLRRPIPAEAYINITKYRGSVSNISLINRTLSQNATFSDITGSTLEMTFSLAFTVPMKLGLSFYVILVQSINATEGKLAMLFNHISAYDEHHKIGNGFAIAPGTKISGSRAIYWWDNNFSYNGRNANSVAGFMPVEGGLDLLFVFKVPPTTGKLSLTQDPFISFPGINFGNNPVYYKVQHAVDFFLQHLRFMALGVIAGTIILGLSYYSYRSRRVKF